MKRKLGFGLVIAIVVLILGAAAYRALLYPELITLDPATLHPNEVVSLFGLHFGNQQGSVLLDDAPLLSSAILHWSPQLISFRMPHGIDSAAVRVKTTYGRSRALMIANKDKVPVPIGNSTPVIVQPMITGVKPVGSAAVGTSVTIEGERFGEADTDSELCITRTSGASIPNQNDVSNFVHISASDPLVERWDEHSIVFRIPDTAESGFIFIRTPNGVSNLYPLKILRPAGQLLRTESARYELEQRITVHVTASLPEGKLSLFVPLPIQSAYERISNSLIAGKEYFNAEGRGWMEFNFGEKEAHRGKIEIIARSFIEMSEIKADLKLSGLQEVPKPIPAFLASALVSDSLIPADNPLVVAAAAVIAKKEKNPYYRVARASQWLSSAIRVQNTTPLAEDSAASALGTGKGSPRGSVLAFTAMLRALGIPAVPVSGFLMCHDGTAVPHFWVEYYLMGLGWIPMDPLLAQGYKPVNFKPGFTDPAQYLRGIDTLHVGISRGSCLLPSFGPEAVRKQKSPWSLLPFDEASSGISSSVIRQTPKLTTLAF